MKFDNPYLFVAAVLVVYESSLLIGPVGLNHNSYKDVLQLTVGSTSALYAVCFISKNWRSGVSGKCWKCVAGNLFTSWDYTS